MGNMGVLGRLWTNGQETCDGAEDMWTDWMKVSGGNKNKLSNGFVCSPPPHCFRQALEE